MSSVYDNWERLVAATLDREKLHQLALLSSKETSFNSSISSAFNISPYNSPFITVLDYVPGSLTDRVIKAAGNSVIFKKECLEIKSKAESLAGNLREAARVCHKLYEGPTRHIVSITELVLEKALKLVMKCSRHGMKRVFNIIHVDSFQKVSSLLENSIEGLSWLISISHSETNAELRLPALTINGPILCVVWEQITTLYVGSMDDQSDAAASLASLARGSGQHGKLIIEEGGVGPLLKLVEKGSLEGQVNAIRAIGWLVRNPENAQHMIAASAPQLFVKMLIEGPMKVQANVAWVVSVLAMHYPECQNLFAQHDIVAVLVRHLAFETVHEVGTSNKARAMEHPITKVRMKEMATKALWQLAKGNSSICISIIESCAIPCFAVLSEKRVVYYSSMVLSEIIAVAEKNPQLRRSAFAPNSSNCKPLVSQLHRVLEMVVDSDLLISCIKTMGHFATTLEETERSMMISPLLKLMRRNESKVSIAACIKVSIEVCIALTKLCSVKKIIDAGGVYTIVDKVYFGGFIVRSYALPLLCTIAINMPDNEEVAQREVFEVLKWASRYPSLREDAGMYKLLSEAMHKLEIHLTSYDEDSIS